MEQFPHLNFVRKLDGKPRYHGGGGQNPKTVDNKKNRGGHSQKLQRWTTNNKSNWDDSLSQRIEQDLAPLDEEVIPIFIQVNPDIINAEFDLESYGIEVISEENDGYLIGASLDKFRTLEEKIQGFAHEKHNTGGIANFWEILDGNRDEWRPKHILSEVLYAKWSEIQDDTLYSLEVSIAFSKTIGEKPDPRKQGGEKRLRNYNEKLERREELLMDREEHFQNFIHHYGEIKSALISLEDSIGCEVSITGKGLKDLVNNYQFVFEVSEIEEISGITGNDGDASENEIDILPPDEDAIEIGVIDSGIMENHRFLAPAIKKEKSQSYISTDSSTVDSVLGGGHGTKVAGTILYPNGITGLSTPYQLPCFVRNLRILNANNILSHNYPADLMQRIVIDNPDCDIFNLSVTSNAPHRTRHMSSWAAMIDQLSFDEDLLFFSFSRQYSFTRNITIPI